MPLYEYQCRKCGHRFEKIQKFSDPLVKKCPECGGAVEQLLSAPAVQFKGSGWYVTDYARKDGAKKPGASADGTGKAEPAGDKAEPKAEKTDARTEKAESKPQHESGKKAHKK